MLLHIHKPENLRLGMVLCLHINGSPEPDLNSDQNPFVKLLNGQDSTSVHGRGSHFYACDRLGQVLNQTGVAGAVMPMRISPAPEVNFVPAFQFNWNEMQQPRAGRQPNGDEKKFVVYNSRGELLQRLTYRNVTFRLPDGTERIGDSYDPLYYRPTRKLFTLEGKPVNENPETILKTFAEESKCEISDLVFVPSA